MIHVSAGEGSNSLQPGTLISPTKFPDGTSQVWKLPPEFLAALDKEWACTILWDFQDEAEIVQVSQLATLLQTYCQDVHLDMPFMPYGRQDKHVANDTTFALRAFADLINSMCFASVRTLDAHSQKADMIERLENKSARPYVRIAVMQSGANTILFPDAGAEARYSNAMAIDFPRMRISNASKNRDQATGKITGIQINEGSVRGRRVLMVDDLCDGGATFTALAEVALADGAKSIDLYVTHGLFTKGLDALRNAGIKRIWTYKGEVK